MMELKYQCCRPYIMEVIRFNRTMMELKCIMEIDPSALVKSFNRTMMELKFCDIKVFAILGICFNRTMMELK